jgi:hypothetical protein
MVYLQDDAPAGALGCERLPCRDCKPSILDRDVANRAGARNGGAATASHSTEFVACRHGIGSAGHTRAPDSSGAEPRPPAGDPAAFPSSPRARAARPHFRRQQAGKVWQMHAFTDGTVGQRDDAARVKVCSVRGCSSCGSFARRCEEGKLLACQGRQIAQRGVVAQTNVAFGELVRRGWTGATDRK